MTQKQNLIISAVDNAIDFSANVLRGLNHTIYSVPDYMVDDTKKMETKDWCYWKPLKANINSQEFERYEQETGIALTESYIMFLSYIHFIDLNFGHDVIFFPHTKNWIDDNLALIERYGRSLTVEKGFLPFADMNDWGIVCFDSTKKVDDEHDIIYFDDEDRDNPKRFIRGHYNFVNLICDMNQVLNEWRQAKIAN